MLHKFCTTCKTKYPRWESCDCKNTKTITIEIPVPPAGWAYENREPIKFEEFMCFQLFGECKGTWSLFTNSEGYWTSDLFYYAYRIRDDYADRYEALKLPDGWAWTHPMSGPAWKQQKPEFCEGNPNHLRRIVSGKAVMP